MKKTSKGDEGMEEPYCDDQAIKVLGFNVMVVISRLYIEG